MWQSYLFLDISHMFTVMLQLRLGIYACTYHTYIGIQPHICLSKCIQGCIHSYMYTCTHASIHEIHAYLGAYNIYVCMHPVTCIHTFPHRNIYNFRMKHFHNFWVSVLSDFQNSRILIVLEIWKSGNFGNTEILELQFYIQFLIDNYHLPFTV